MVKIITILKQMFLKYKLNPSDFSIEDIFASTDFTDGGFNRVKTTIIIKLVKYG